MKVNSYEYATKLVINVINAHTQAGVAGVVIGISGASQADRVVTDGGGSCDARLGAHGKYVVRVLGMPEGLMGLSCDYAVEYKEDGTYLASERIEELRVLLLTTG